MQYLIHCGADLGIRSVERETARDIAVRMRKMALLEVVEDACMCRIGGMLVVYICMSIRSCKCMYSTCM